MFRMGFDPVSTHQAMFRRIPLPFRLIGGRPKDPFSVSYSFSVSTKSAQIIRKEAG